jgi:hypothetical protein
VRPQEGSCARPSRGQAAPSQQRPSQGDCEVAKVRSAVLAMCSVQGRVIDADPRPRECVASVIDADRRLLEFTAEFGWDRLTLSSRLCGAWCGSDRVGSSSQELPK